MKPHLAHTRLVRLVTLRSSPSRAKVPLLHAGLILSLACAPALAQPTDRVQLITEASNDGGFSWRSLIVSQPGDVVQLRVRMVYTGTLAPDPVRGLAGLTFQSTLSGWDASSGDTRLPFTNESTGAGVPYAPDLSALGRIQPFDTPGMNSASASGLLTSFNDPGGVLRIAGARAPDTASRFGIAIAQLPQSLAGAAFRPGFEAVIFKYAVQLGTSSILQGPLTAGVPLESITNQQASIYRSASGSDALRITIAPGDISTATIVLPSPQASLILVAGLLASSRRRRPLLA